MLIRLICLMLATVILTGCATGNTDADISTPLKKDRGIAIVSLTKSGLEAWQVIYHYEQINGDLSGTLMIDADLDGNIESDYVSVQGNLKLLELPAGDFRITRWQLKRWGVTRKSAVPLDIRFRVYPGKFTYAGELNLDTANQRIQDVGSVGVAVQVKGAAERDIRYIQLHYPQVDFTRFRMRPMQMKSPEY